MKKTEESEYVLDILKYKKFKEKLAVPADFKDKDEDLAIEYYHKQLEQLLKMSNRSLESLMIETTTSNFPSEPAGLAKVILGYIEEIQGI